jgi:hypothetical protein
VKRSTFIKVSVLGIVAALLAVYIFRFKKVVRLMLERDSSMMNFRKGNEIDRFMADADKEDYWRQFSKTKQLFICFHHFFASFGIHLPYYQKYRQYRNAITGHFLLSTDFCTNGMDSSEEVEYVRFYNQYRQPCSNPFSVTFYPETA